MWKIETVALGSLCFQHPRYGSDPRKVPAKGIPHISMVVKAMKGPSPQRSKAPPGKAETPPQSPHKGAAPKVGRARIGGWALISLMTMLGNTFSHLLSGNGVGHPNRVMRMEGDGA